MVTDILDLIDGALEDHTVSADAARWLPDEASRDLANAAARWVTAAEVPDGTAGPYGAGEWTGQHASGERIDWVGCTIPASADETQPTRTIQVTVAGVDGADEGFSWIDAHRAHASVFGQSYLLVQPGPDADSPPILRPILTDEARLGRSVDILAAAAAWYGHETLARHAAEMEARAQRSEQTWGPIWDEAFRLIYDLPLVPLVPVVQVSRRCPVHEDAGEPTDPRERALWLRRNRNTGPRTKPRAPRRIDARGSR